MSITPTAAPAGPGAPRRVRDQARDVVVLMAFSAIASTTLAAAFLVLAHLSRTGR
jgi:hypothetical protein